MIQLVMSRWSKSAHFSSVSEGVVPSIETSLVCPMYRSGIRIPNELGERDSYEPGLFLTSVSLAVSLHHSNSPRGDNARFPVNAIPRCACSYLAAGGVQKHHVQ